MWSREHGLVGHSHGCRGATGGVFLFAWHGWHRLTRFTKSASMPGHHTTPLAKAFIYGTFLGALRVGSALSPLCPLLVLLTTQLPQRRQSSCTLSSWLLIQYWEVSPGCSVLFSNFLCLRLLSLLIGTDPCLTSFVWRQLTPRYCPGPRFVASRQCHREWGTSMSGPFSGSLLRASAFACSFPALKTIL